MTNDKKVNVAIIGTGFGAEFIPIYQKHPNANMYGVCRRNESELNKVADAFGIEKRFTDYNDVLNDQNVDFVHINSPIPDHGWMSIEALKAGKNVMCTVPMATTIEECKEIVQLVKETGLKYMMAETVVYSREFLYIKDLYDRGELGKIQYMKEYWKLLKDRKMMIGRVGLNYFLSLLYLEMMQIELCKKMTHHGHILQMTLVIIWIKLIENTKI